MNNNLHKIRQIIKAIMILIIANIGVSFLFAIVFTLTKQESVSYLISYTISCAILLIINHKKLMHDLKNVKKDYQGKIINIIIFTIILLMVMGLSNIILYKLSGNLANNEVAVRELFFSSPIIMAISIGFLAPIFEELVIRYPYRNIKIKPILKMLLYSSLFAILHLYNVNSIYDFLYIIPYFFLSLSFSYSFYKTNNIYGSILVHILNNSITLLLLLIF